MEINVERLENSPFELSDAAAMKLCLLSTGALLGLSVKSKFARRVAGLGCTILAAGLAIPLAEKYLDRAEPGEPIVGVKVEKGEEDSAETLFEFKVEKEPEEPNPPADPTQPPEEQI